MWNIKQKVTNKQIKEPQKNLINTNNTMLVARGEKGWEELEEGNAGDKCGIYKTLS